MKTPLYASFFLWITWMIWWFLWSRDILLYSSFLLFWFAVHWIIRDYDVLYAYKKTLLTIVTSLCLWFVLQSLFAWNILSLIFVVIMRIITVRGMQWRLTDWLWWWKKQLSHEFLWFVLSCMVSILVLWTIWLSMPQKGYVFASSVWLLCLLIVFMSLWYTLKQLHNNLYIIGFWFMWFMTLLYTIMQYFF